MPKQIVVAIFDSAVQGYGRPFFVPTAGAALRSFRDEVNRANEENQLYRHPEDFELHQLADFDDENGVFTPYESHCLMRGKDAKETT